MRALVFALLLLAGPAWAGMTDGDASALRAALQDWVKTWTGGLLGPLPVQVRPDGDDLAIELPFGGTTPAVTTTPGRFTARVRPSDRGRWAIDTLTVPAAGTFSTPASRSQWTIGKQAGSGVLDPSLAWESRLDLRIEDYTLQSSGPAGSNASHVASITSHLLWAPAADGRLTMTEDTSLDGYTVRTTQTGAKPGPPVDVSIQRIRSRGLIDDVSLPTFGTALRNLLKLASAPAATGPTKRQLSPQQLSLLREALHGAIAASGDWEEQQDWTGIAFRAAGQSAALKHMAVGLSLRSAGDRVTLKLPLALEGFAAPQIGNAAVQAVLPQSLRLTPVLSGLSKPALVELLDRAMSAAGPSDPSAELTRLLARSNVAVGLDDLAFDIGPMKVTGTGRLAVPSLEAMSGEAELRATGLDALIRQSSGVPALKQAVPVLIFLKGIAEQEGATAIWKISFADGAVTVNGTSLSDMMVPSK